MADKTRLQKTNAMRLLEAQSIAYETIFYEDDGSHALETGAAVKLAQALGLDPAAVFKTIVMRTERGKFACFVFPLRWK